MQPTPAANVFAPEVPNSSFLSLLAIGLVPIAVCLFLGLGLDSLPTISPSSLGCLPPLLISPAEP